MTHEQFKHERDYGAAAALAVEMAARGLVTPEEHAKLDAIMHKTYRPLIGKVLRFMGPE